jgi:hypothetical protein
MIDFVDRTLEDYLDLDHAEGFGDEATWSAMAPFTTSVISVPWGLARRRHA